MSFVISDFLPYLLNRAAEQSSMRFQKIYKDRFGMLRTEWRVLFHLGFYGPLTASAICEMAGLHKTKVSRAVSALEDKQYLTRLVTEADKRFETLSLTKSGQETFAYLEAQAEAFHKALMAPFSDSERAVLHKCLLQLKDASADSEL